MADTTFVTGTPIDHEWLNDVNDDVYTGPVPLTLGTSVLRGNGLGKFGEVYIGDGLQYASFTMSIKGLTGSANILYEDPVTHGVAPVTIGTGLSFSGGTLACTVVGTVTSVSATSPVVSSGGATPTISLPAANTSTSGYLTSTDWNTFNSKQPAGSYAPATSGTDILIGNGSGGFGTLFVGDGLQYASSTISIKGMTGASNLLYETGTGGFAAVTIGTGLSFTGGTLSNTVSAGVTSVSGTSPISSTGGATPVISVAAGSTSVVGVVQLEDSTSSTSTTKAATPNAVKTSYDLANAALPKSGGTMTGAITLNGDPTSNLHAASKQYVDALAVGLQVKAPCRVATYGAGTLASSFENGDTVDGVVIATGDRILIKDQAALEENGIYVVNASGAPTRATDMDAWSEVPQTYVWIYEGTQNANSSFFCLNGAGGTINVDPIAFTTFSLATSYTAGTGLTLAGNQFSVTANTYAPVTSGTSLLYGNGAGGFNSASIGTWLSFSSGTLSNSIPAANGSTNGYLTSTDWTTFNSKQAAGTYVTSVSGTAPVVSSGGTTPAISMASASGSVSGYLTNTDWNTFNGKQSALGYTPYNATNPAGYTSNTGTVTSVAALTLGTAGTDLGSSVANSTTTPVITLNVPTASAVNRGVLSAADWSTFNNKQPSGSYAPATSGTSILIGNGSGGFASLYVGDGLQYASSTISVKGMTGSANILYENGTGSFSPVTIGTGLSFSGGTLSSTIAGTVTSVGATSPVLSSGGTTPTISLPAASGSVNGYLSSTDWNTFNSKQAAGSYLVNGGSLGTPSAGNLANCTFPTLDQNTTGSAAKWTTARLIGGNSVDGSANVPLANAFIIQQADGSLTGAQNIGLLTTGLLKNTVTAGVGILSKAIAGTDYTTPTSGSSILSGDGAGGFSNVTVGTGLSFSAGTLASTTAGTVTHTVGGLTADSVVVGNSAADVKTVDTLKVYANDAFIAGNAYGKIISNIAAAAWTPACGGVYGYHSSYLPSIGLSSRGTASALWGTYVQDYFSVGFTNADLYNSHYNTWAAYAGVPSGLVPTTQPGGSWNSPPFSGGAPSDPYYTEIGGYAVTLGIGTAGNYAEGVGVTVKDIPVFEEIVATALVLGQRYVIKSVGTSDFTLAGAATNAENVSFIATGPTSGTGTAAIAVAARLTGSTVEVKKSHPANTWLSHGYVSGSTGAQGNSAGLTYAPYSAYMAYGGWQIGLDLSGGQYHIADINFKNATITSDATNLYVNVGGTNILDLASTGGLLHGNVTGNDYSYTGTVTGLSGTHTGTVKYSKIGNVITMDLFGDFGTSTATTMTITGGTAAMRPASNKQVLIGIYNNSSPNLGLAMIAPSGVITFYSDIAGAAFSSSGIKGFTNTSFSYTLL